MIRIYKAVVAHVYAVLIGNLFGQHGGVNNLDVGLETEVGSRTVAFHVVEVEVVNLTILQTAELLDIVERDAALGDGVCATHIQHADPVDVQIHVIVAGEVEIQVVILIEDKLRMALQGHIVVCVFVIVRNVVLVRVNNFKIFVSVVSEILPTDRIKPILRLQVTTDIGRACSGSDMIRLAVVDHAFRSVINAAVVGGVINIIITLLDKVDLVILLHSLPIPRVIAVQILQQEVSSIIIGAAILCLGKRLAFGIRHAAQPAIDTLAEHLCQITGCTAGVADIVVIVVKQLSAHDIPHVIGAIAVLPFFRERFLHILSDIPNRCLRINRLSVSTEHRLNKVCANVAPIKRLHRAAVQDGL